MYFLMLTTTLGWLAVVVLVITACQSAARADAGARRAAARIGGGRERGRTLAPRRIRGGERWSRPPHRRAGRAAHGSTTRLSAHASREHRR